MNCTSCGAAIKMYETFVEFECPNCGETKIIRCKKCKILANKYVCKKCKFVGP